MRSILLSLAILPLLASAQINRSAKELAGETIATYITKKLFKDKPYHPVSFGELKECKEQNSEVMWSFVHKFEITESKGAFGKDLPASKAYTFIFYMDKKMNVRRAEGAFIVQ